MIICACKTRRGASVASICNSIGAVAGALDKCAAWTDCFVCADAVKQTSKHTHTTRKVLTRLIKALRFAGLSLNLQFTVATLNSWLAIFNPRKNMNQLCLCAGNTARNLKRHEIVRDDRWRK